MYRISAKGCRLSNTFSKSSTINTFLFLTITIFMLHAYVSVSLCCNIIDTSTYLYTYATHIIVTTHLKFFNVRIIIILINNNNAYVILYNK